MPMVFCSRPAFAAAAALMLLGAASRAGAAPPPPNDSRGNGKTVYDKACATCHGPDGRGASRSHVVFDLPLPDFTNCEFAPREGNHDWAAIVHEGGPKRGFNRLMPAFGQALTDDEVGLALAYMRTFCRSRAWPRGELNLPRPLNTEKAFPEDEVVTEFDFDAEQAGAASYAAVIERRIGPRTQWEVKLPYHVQPRAGDTTIAGVGDIAAALKHAFYHSVARGTIVSVAGEVGVPTGVESRGFGAGTAKFETSLMAGQILPLRMFLQGQAGFAVPADRSKAAREAFWRAVLGHSRTTGRFGRLWSPMVEILGAREMASGEKAQWDVVPQMQVTLSTRQHIRAAGGVQIPLTDPATRSTRIAAYLLWDWYDGGLFEGW